VAVLSEDAEITPNEAAVILGISRPLVVHRMDIGDLPFRYVGKHRRARLADVLALKAKLDEQRSALKALAKDTDEVYRMVTEVIGRIPGVRKTTTSIVPVVLKDVYQWKIQPQTVKAGRRKAASAREAKGTN
jgi:excisionase family DNA binding protein